MSEHDIKETVKEKYAAAALKVLDGERGACGCDPVSDNLYDASEKSTLPEGAVLASLGCGNPSALADLHEGEVVLDLGSGGGIDVLLSAKRVGPTGKAYGLDMTDEMLALARANQGRVLNEAFRVLRAGGRFAVSDVVCRGEVPDVVRHSMELWVGCIAGALGENEYRGLLSKAGFVDIDIEPTRVYEFKDAGIDDVLWREVSGRVMGAFIRARKPALAPRSPIVK